MGFYNTTFLSIFDRTHMDCDICDELKCDFIELEICKEGEHEMVEMCVDCASDYLEQQLKEEGPLKSSLPFLGNGLGIEK